MKRPVRPVPTEKIVDYDDGDPYSCMAAGRAEEDMQRALQARVEECFGKPAEQLQKLVSQDRASVRTALFDIWTGGRLTRQRGKLAEWAAEQMALLGDSSLADYDRVYPTGP